MNTQNKRELMPKCFCGKPALDIGTEVLGEQLSLYCDECGNPVCKAHGEIDSDGKCTCKLCSGVLVV